MLLCYEKGALRPLPSHNSVLTPTSHILLTNKLKIAIMYPALVNDHQSDADADRKGQEAMLQQPLLVKTTAEEDTSVSSNETPTANDEPCSAAAKSWAAIAGAFFAILSQLTLSSMLWNESILSQPAFNILWFSLRWSCWTCCILFMGLFLIMQLICTSSQPKGKPKESHLFQVEAYYVVSSLLAISTIWMLDEAAVYVVPLLVTLLVLQSSSSLLMTYSLVAGTLGLIFGVCSQFVLSLVFWHDVEMKDPIMNSVLAFSLAWSLATVVLTFVGCYSLRWIVENDLRAFLRMEAVYIAASLTGICSAWICMDLSAGLPEQVVPSLVMLVLSLVAFGVILWCFPEDKCLEEAQKELKEAERKKNAEKLLMMVV